MSLRSDPNVEPSRPDPVTRNQPQVNSDQTTGTEGMPGNYPDDTNDSTSSGGYGASPEMTWSDKAQRGVNLPTGNEIRSPSGNDMGSDTGLIDKATDGTNLKDELQDAIQGRDGGSGPKEDEWGIEKGAGKDF